MVETPGVGGKPPIGGLTWGIWSGMEKDHGGGKIGIAFNLGGATFEAKLERFGEMRIRVGEMMLKELGCARGCGAAVGPSAGRVFIG